MKEMDSTEMPIILNIIFKKSSFLERERMIHISKRQLLWSLSRLNVLTRPAVAILQADRSQLEDKTDTAR